MLRLFRRDTSGARSGSQLEVSHGGEAYKVALKRVVGARRFTLRVRSATRDVVLTMPVRGSVSAAKEFAERHAAWIGARLRRLPQPVPFLPGFEIPYRGIAHRIVHRPTQRLPVVVETIETELERDMPALCVGGDEPFVARRLRDFLKREARRDLEASVLRHASTIGKTVRRITIRDTTSRWGSCSVSQTLNFSWRLIMAPPFVLDYLAAHEVAHLMHLNHSPRFWALTRQLSDDTDRAETWLKAHGADLHRFGQDDVDVDLADVA
jgi:predicted metal-dependent hydrolase